MAGRGGGNRPGSASASMSVEQIVAVAQNYDYNPQVSLTSWLRSARMLLKEADIYEHEGNDEQAYLFLFRHAQLVLGRLTQRHDIQPADRIALAKAEQDCKAGLAKMEVLKPRITKRHEHHQRIQRERAARQGTAKEPARTKSRDATPTRHPSGAWDDDAGPGQLAAGEHRDLAVQLAKKEIRRRAAARKATLRAGISEEVEQERRTGGMWGGWENDLANDGNVLSQQMQNVRVQVDGRQPQPQPQQQQQPRESGRRVSQPVSSHAYKYPSVQQSQPVRRDSTGVVPRRPPKGFVESMAPPPPPPPKDDIYSPPPSASASAPARPPKQPHPQSESATSLRSSISTPSHADVPSLKPSEFTFKPAAYLENGTPLRTVFLPPDLRHRFMAVAAPNTARNLETCGILCGTLISNALFISKLVVPEQISTSDTCETVNEGALFDYVDSEDLMVFGWIHTHPSQTCFMSSRDLHTHAGYQAMLPESLAIVCAPSKQPDWGVFRLTDPPGLKAVLACTQSGLFHPHEERNMYTDALRPGHVFEAKGLEWDVHDMRK